MKRALAIGLFAYGMLQAASGDGLRYVVVVERHGVRAPSWTPAQLQEFSAAAWPDFGVPPSNLTPRGAQLIKMLGAFDRTYVSGQGLMRPSGCEDAARISFRADTDQRTIATARALADGMLPGCNARVDALNGGTKDPLFHALAAGLGHPDRARAYQEVMQGVGGDPQSLLVKYRAEFAELKRVLGGGKTGLGDKIAVKPGEGDALVDITGPVRYASTFTENFLLEYANGLDGKDLGWGRINAANLRELIRLHCAYADLARRTPYIARAAASNLMSHIRWSLQQAVDGKPVAGAIGAVGDKALFLVAHDTNITNLAGLLGMSWALPGYEPNDTPPGGSLVFELWRQDGRYFVQSYYTAQSLDQLHNAVPLTSAAPPLKSATAMTGCATDRPAACDWTAFQLAIDRAVDPGFVRR